MGSRPCDSRSQDISGKRRRLPPKPEGRQRIAQRFNAGMQWIKGRSPARDDRIEARSEQRLRRFLPSLRDLAPNERINPALKGWAIFGPPSERSFEAPPPDSAERALAGRQFGQP